MDRNMQWATILTTIYICSLQTEAVRLNTIMESSKGTLDESFIHGALHVGHNKQKPGKKEILYQQYQTKNKHEPTQIKPRVLAEAKIPVNLREQSQTFKTQLATVRNENTETVPGTQKMKLRERQIKEALKGKGHDLRTRINAKHFMSKSIAKSGMPLPTLL